MRNNSFPPTFLFRRCAAFLYDCLLLVALYFVIGFIAVGLNDGKSIPDNALKYGALFIIAYVFFSWFWRHGGQTLGMQAWRIKLVSENGDSISHFQCLKRFLAGTLFFGLTYIAMLFNPARKALHDTVSDTKIIFISKT